MEVCDMIVNIVVGVATGLVSSAIVSVVFYFKGVRDQRAVYRKLQMDEALMRLAILDPNRRPSVRHGDGVDDTCHWLLCKADLMESDDFMDGAHTLREVEREIQKCPAQPQPESPNRTDEHTANIGKKNKWADQIRRVKC